MSLPRELRDQISSYVIHAERQPIPLDKPFDELIAGRTVYRSQCLGAWNKTVFSIEEDEVGNASPLLRINQQYRAETLENIRTFSKSTEYKIDIIILDEIVPLPTWTYVPFLTTRLDKVTATFRISGSYIRDLVRRSRKRKVKIDEDIQSEEEPARQGEQDRSPADNELRKRWKGFRIGNGAGPAMGWQIYSILERFLELGPQSDAQHQRATHDKRKDHKHYPMAIKTLEINIETPSGIDPARFSPPAGRRRELDTDFVDTVLDPQYLFRFVRGDILTLLRGQSHEWFHYGKVLFEHVDYVVFKLDGEFDEQQWGRVCDVAKELKAAGGFQERYFSQDQLREYKEEAWRIRKERGLRGLEDCE